MAACMHAQVTQAKIIKLLEELILHESAFLSLDKK
jgi:hypothetical protein